MGWKDKIKNARLPEATVRIALRGDLAAEYDQLLMQIEQAKARKANTLAGSGVAVLEDRLAAVIEEMQDSVIEFKLRALPRTKKHGDRRPSFAELKKLHPPREVNGEMSREDIMAGFVNAETFADPLVRNSIVDPPLDDDDWDELEISQGQFDELVSAAWTLNQGRVDIPFSRAGSQTTPSSGSE